MADSLRPKWRDTFFGLVDLGTGSLRPRGETRFLAWLALGWRASRSSGVSRAKAGGEGSRTPVIPNLVHRPPRTSENGLNTGSDDFMEAGGFAWMLPLSYQHD
jgi:hypothetical protein